MVNTTRRQLVITAEADQAMQRLSDRLSNGNVSQLYRDAVASFLASHGIEVNMVVEVGSPALLALRDEKQAASV